MANESDEDRIEEEQLKEEDGGILGGNKKIFINQVDSYHGKHIARVSEFFGDFVGLTKQSAEEEEANLEKQKQVDDDQPIDDGWKVWGTLKNSQGYIQPPFIREIIKYEDRNQLIDYLTEMNVIIYDITQDPGQVDEAVWICQKLESMIKVLNHSITFILLSTVMTWAKTSSDEEGVPFSEDEFRRRRTHPSFKEHYTAEKVIIKLGTTNKNKLCTYIVATGLTYGMEENVFHYLFKAAWQNVPELQVFGKGGHFLPTIHVLDLAAVLQNLADRQFKTRYVVAVDTSKETLIRITRKVGQTLGSGKIKIVEQEDAMLNKDITQTDYEMLFIDMQFEPMFIKEHLNLKWHCENGLIENIQKVVEEYRLQRNLVPIKICILGPPASGKTTIAKQLAQEYRLPHLQLKDVLEETKSELEHLVKRAGDEDEMNEEETEEIVGERLEEAKNLLEKLDEIRRDSKYTRLDDETLSQILKMKLMAPACQNQGYILDGYPKTFDQAQSLFGVPGEEDEEGADEKKPPVNERIIPEYIFILEASNTYLRERVMHLPEKLVAGTHNTEFEFKRRLRTYNELGDDFHPAKFFEDFDRLCETIKIDDDRSLNHRHIVEKIMERVRKPHNYGLSAEEEELVKRKELFDKEKREREEREERERDEQDAENDRKKKQKEWTTKLEQVKHDEHQVLDTQSLPLRNYLMVHVMPTLTKALIECCQVQPDDPVDFVAEYLFKNNPQM